MKKLLVLIITTIIMTSCSQTKIGYVDVQEIMKDYDAAKTIEEQLKLEQDAMSKSLDSLMNPFQVKVQDFYAKADKMSASKRGAAEQALQQENQMIQMRQQQLQQQLQQKGIVEIEKLTKLIDSAVANYAVTNNYQMVIATQGNGQVIYGDDSSNLTETIIDLLNADLESEE